MNWYQITIACVTGVGFLSCVSFVSSYAIRSRMKWMRTEHGWFLMCIAGSLGSLFALACANQVLGNWPGRQVVSIIVLAALALMTFWLPRILWVSIKLAEKEFQRGKEAP